MERLKDATHGCRAGHFYKADPLVDLNWLKWIDGRWVGVGTLPAGTLKPLCDVLDYAPPQPAPMPHIPSASTPFPTPPCVPVNGLPQSIFDNFGGNWRWASIDYRGVARVHTFEPTFTASGRIEVPRGKHNSQPCEAFDMVDGLPADWTPVWVTRDAWPRGKVTDRFGMILPAGADPVEAADVAQAPTMASLKLEPVPSTKYPDGEKVIINNGHGEFVDAVVIGLDGPLYVVKSEYGYDGVSESNMQLAPSERDKFVIAVCKVLDWDAAYPQAVVDACKLYDAGCRL